jgi:hypothetical protein
MERRKRRKEIQIGKRNAWKYETNGYKQNKDV